MIFMALVVETTDAAIFIVENTDNSGPGSLRQAILDANAAEGADFIHFNIPANGPHTIRPTSELPPIADTVNIDGFTQGSQTANPADDAVPNTNPMDQPINAVYKIELDGTDAGLSTSGFHITGDGVVIRGLVINRFRVNGILVDGGSEAAIEGNFIGTNLSGTEVAGNGEDGVNLTGASNSRIGGADPSERNLISGNDDGIDIQDLSSGNVVAGNFIGTDLLGSSALPNSQQGVKVDNSHDNQIGGTASGERNLISGNSLQGLGLLGGASGNQIQGNFIGTNLTGTGPLPNRGEGIQIQDSPDNLIGGTEGTTPGSGCNGACNLISGNLQEGILIGGGGAVENRISGNHIGVNQVGSGAMGNGFDGILIGSGGDGTFIGGIAPGSGNIIAHNSQDGVTLGASAGDGVSILGNSIHSNGALGIDLNNNGVSNNDLGPPPDQDNGANNLQNFPVLQSVSVFQDEVQISGVLQSTPNTDFRIEFFANTECDPTQHGEGERFLGFEIVETDAEGLAVLQTTLSAAVQAGEHLTSTATVIDGPTSHASTSEFSMCSQIGAGQCPSPLPDFAVNGRADANDLIALIEAHRNGDVEFDLTCDLAVNGEDLFQFSLRWRETETP